MRKYILISILNIAFIFPLISMEQDFSNNKEVIESEEIKSTNVNNPSIILPKEIKNLIKKLLLANISNRFYPSAILNLTYTGFPISFLYYQISLDGKFIVLCRRSENPQVWNLETGELVWSSKEPLKNPQISSDNKILVGSYYKKNEKSLAAYNLENGELMWHSNESFYYHNFFITPNNEIIGYCETNENLKILDLSTGKLIWETDYKIDACFYLSSNSQFVVVYDKDNSLIKVLDLKTGKLISSMKIFKDLDGGCIKRVINNKIVIIYNKAESKLICWDLEKQNIFEIDFSEEDHFIISPNNKYLIANYSRTLNCLRIYDLENGKFLWQVNQSLQLLKISPDSKFLATRTGYELNVYDLENGKNLWNSSHTIDYYSCDISKDNKIMVRSDDILKVYELKNGELLWETKDQVRNQAILWLDKFIVVPEFINGINHLAIYNLQDGELLFKYDFAKDEGSIFDLNVNSNILEVISSEGILFIINENLINLINNKQTSIEPEFTLEQIGLVNDICLMDNLIKQKHDGQKYNKENPNINDIDIADKSYKVWLTDDQKKLFETLPVFMQTCLKKNYPWLVKNFVSKGNNNNNNNAELELIPQFGKHDCTIQ